MCSIAATTSAARARPRIAPASTAPVPSGFVRTRLSPSRSPPLSRALPSRAPDTVKEMPRSAPSAEWPPTRSTPWRRKTARAPAIIWKRSSSIMASAISGTVASANANVGVAPMANRSFKAWWAPIRPKRYGSPIMARKPSQLTASSPDACTTAASSPMPRTVFGDVSTARRSSVRRRMSAPILAPQPPQRIAWGASSSDSSVAGAAASMFGNSLNLRMKRRSMRCFQRHTQAPAAVNRPRLATALPSPKPTIAMAWRCARNVRWRPFVAQARRLAASVGPWRTA